LNSPQVVGLSLSRGDSEALRVALHKTNCRGASTVVKQNLLHRSI
jgi:hypothetical protein